MSPYEFHIIRSKTELGGKRSEQKQQMAASNPQMQQVMQLIQKHGGDPTKAFYALAEEKGIDPQQILDLLK